MPRNESDAPRRHCLPIEQWPEIDRAAWLHALEAADPFGGNSRASAWRQSTRKSTTSGYGRWLSWCSETGTEMNGPPPDRLTPSRVEAYIIDLRHKNSDATVLTRAEQLYRSIRIIAPGRDWSWLLRAQSALRAHVVPVRQKATRIQPTGELVKLGKALMRDAENAVIKPPLHRAIQFRDGLMIAFLARRPLRLSNLATMTLERHLIRQASGYRLYFSGREVKGGKPIETSVPASLVGDFDRYLEHYRPILLTRGGRQRSSDCNAVWISRIAAALDYKAIPERVTKHTATAFGQPLWVHLFRDCAATTIATEDPTNVRSIIAILGHSTLAISEKYYNQARSLEASRRYQKIVEDWCSSFNERPPL